MSFTVLKTIFNKYLSTYIKLYALSGTKILSRDTVWANENQQYVKMLAYHHNYKFCNNLIFLSYAKIAPPCGPTLPLKITLLITIHQSYAFQAKQINFSRDIKRYFSLYSYVKDKLTIVVPTYPQGSLFEQTWI